MASQPDTARTDRVHGIYTVIRDMDGAQRFYAAALGIAPRFRDGARWCQFRLGEVNFALGSPEEASPGAAGSIAVFETAELDAAATRVAEAGGAVLSRRDMGAHGIVLTCADPEQNLFQFSPAARPSDRPYPEQERFHAIRNLRPE